MGAVFDYRAAQSVAEAIDLLRQHGDDAKVLAGGQSLLPLLNLGLAQPAVLVDINRIAGLDMVQREDGSLAVGALTRHSAAERSDLIRQACPLLATTIPLIGDPQVRARGTIGGSMAHADPVAELPTVAVCLDATMRVEGPSGARDVQAADFFIGYLTTALGPDEVLTNVRFPTAERGEGVSFLELVRRKGDFAIVAAAATMQLAPDGSCSNVRLALAGVASTPVRAAAAAGVLVGQQPTAERLREAALAACEGIEPESDVMASAEYRRNMAVVYARRALAEAAQRASGASTR